mmetsp:Transcript_81831/g.218844  ORF Transcript_81831/g.218844 Transcript_81831/m.218844 type:complete len:342 (+) Transcript_81831:66-1091(+)
MSAKAASARNAQVELVVGQLSQGSITGDALHILRTAAKMTLTLEAENRGSMHQEVLGWIDEELNSQLASLVEQQRSAQAPVEEADKERGVLAAKRDSCSARQTQCETELQGRQAAERQASKALQAQRAADAEIVARKEALQQRLAALGSTDAELKEVEEALQADRDGSDDFVQPLGTRQRIVACLKSSSDIDATMIQCLPAVLQKSKAERSNFEGMTVDQTLTWIGGKRKSLAAEVVQNKEYLAQVNKSLAPLEDAEKLALHAHEAMQSAVSALTRAVNDTTSAQSLVCAADNSSAPLRAAAQAAQSRVSQLQNVISQFSHLRGKCAGPEVDMRCTEELTA